jgi:hypothetical protein
MSTVPPGHGEALTPVTITAAFDARQFRSASSKDAHDPLRTLMRRADADQRKRTARAAALSANLHRSALIPRKRCA